MKQFCEAIQVILHTVNQNEYDAAATYMEPPSTKFERPIVYPETGFVVGKFAGIKIALIKTEAGSKCRDYIQDAIERQFYPNAKIVIGVGVCYAFDKKKFGLADVLVSNKISDFADSKFDGEEVENRGQTIDVQFKLCKIFCNDTSCAPYQVSSTGRTSKIHCGSICSYNALFNSTEMRDKFARQMSKAIGGEMEGGVLLDFQQKGKFEGVIIIKGVSDYGDGKKEKDWQFTAAMAALHYIKEKLEKSCYTESRSLTITVHIHGLIALAREMSSMTTVYTNPLFLERRASACG